MKVRHIARNVVFNWLATAISMAVPFFLTPFVVRHLGPVVYAIWIVAMSAVSYLNLLDLGMRSAVVRYVSKAVAEGNIEHARTFVSAALWFRLALAGAVGVLSLLLAGGITHGFTFPQELRRSAQLTVLLCALGVAVTLVSGVFGAVLAAINRFDRLSSIMAAQTVVRACGVLFILTSGHGLVALACWELLVVTLAGVVTAIVAMRAFPQCRVRVRRPASDVFRTLWTYSLTTFLLMVAVQIVLNTDNLVIATFLPIGLVTFYTIGSSLVSYASQVVSAMSTTFTPLASGLEASGRSKDLRQLLIRGTQATLALALPIGIALVFRGETFIALWIGPAYGKISETVLRILMISMYFAIGNSTAGAMMMAINRHKPVAICALGEAFFNLVLSIVLVRSYGLYGVAWGTSISMAIMHMLFWPRYVRQILNVPITTFLWEGWGKVTLASLPFGLVCALSQRYWPARHLPVFFAEILATLPVYVICLIAVFHKDAASAYTKWQASRSFAAQKVEVV